MPFERKDEYDVPYGSLELGDKYGEPNPRGVMDARGIKNLADHILVNGLLNRLLVQKRTDGNKTHYVIVGGQRRWRAIGQLLKNGERTEFKNKVPVAEVVYRPGKGETVTEMIELQLVKTAENEHHEPMTAHDLARQIYSSVQAGVAQKDVGRLLCKSAAYVSKAYSAYEGAIPELKNAWRDGKIPTDSVQIIARMEAKHQPKAVADELAARKAGTIPPSLRKKAARREASRLAKKGDEPRPAHAQRISDNRTREVLAQLSDKVTDRNKYVSGLVHGLELALGLRGYGELGDDFLKFCKQHKLGAMTDRKKPGPKPKAKTKTDTKTKAKKGQ